MASSPESGGASGVWIRLAVLALVIAALGLPVNDLFRYALLLIATMVVFAGAVSRRPAAWGGALAIVAVAAAGQVLLASPRIEEGHNVFLLDEGRSGALQGGLPAEAFRFMAAEFDATYPPERRCDPRASGCWRNGPFPDRTYAFSADGIAGKPAYSRRVADIGFSDPVWARLGFINERYNWYGGSDLQRNTRERSLLKVLNPWQLTMPYFVMFEFPAGFVGSRLCWQGEVLWEAGGERFTVWRHPENACRIIESGDVGRRIFGVSIAAPLAMSLDPTLTILLRQFVEPGLALLAVAAVLLMLVRWRLAQLRLPLVLIGLSLAVVFLNDASFIGGVRPFDGGDDGLVYDGWSREMLQRLLSGDILGALEGREKVFYFTPGMRYFRAIEHLIVGESYLAYLSLMLLLPFLVFIAAARFLSRRAALATALMFVAIPVGAAFGSTFFQYAKWAARGFADPAAAAMFLAGFVLLVGPAGQGPLNRLAPAWGVGFLFALALFVRPNLAPGAAVLLGGAGVAALWQLQLKRLAGLCVGFLPVFGMALHNWYFGGVFVLFSSNANIPATVPMPPSAYLAALGELLRFDFGGEHVRSGILQIARWLAGPSESFLMIPLDAAAVAVLVRVGFRHGADPWLRLTAWATLALHSVALFYVSDNRYYFLTWFFTLLVVLVWLRDEGLGLSQRRFPRATAWMIQHPLRRWLAHVLDWWCSFTRIAPVQRRG